MYRSFIKVGIRFLGIVITFDAINRFNTADYIEIVYYTNSTYLRLHYILFLLSTLFCRYTLNKFACELLYH